MFDTEQQLINEIITLLNESNNTILTGYATQAGNGTNIAVKIANTTQTAYALNVTSPGAVNLIYIPKDKKWIAYQVNNFITTQSNLITYRKSRTNVVVKDDTIKILFYIQTKISNIKYQYDFYIGGDRATPTKIYTVNYRYDDLPVDVYFSSTGTALNAWAVGIRDTTNSQLITIHSDQTYTYTYTVNIPFQWAGNGLWTATLENNGYTLANKQYTSSFDGTYTTGSSHWDVVSTATSTFPDIVGSGDRYEHGRGIQGVEETDPVENHGTQNYTCTTVCYSLYKGVISKNTGAYTESYQGDTLYTDLPNPGNLIHATNVTNGSGTTPVKLLPNKTINKLYTKLLYADTAYPLTTLNNLDKTDSITLIAGNLKYNSAIYQRSTRSITDVGTYPPNSNIVHTDTQVYKLGYFANTTTEIPWLDDYQVITNQDGASFIKKAYCYVPPSADAVDLYEHYLWKNKKAINYSEKNIYDATDPTKTLTNVPVWKAVIDTEKQIVSVRPDISVPIVYSILSSATVVAASYFGSQAEL